MSNKELEKEILKIRLKMEKAANKKNMKLYKEYKKQLDKLKAMIGAMYLQYGEDDILHMTQFEKNKAMKEIENELVDVHKGLSPFEVGLVYAILNKSYKDTYYRTAYTIERGIDVKAGINYKLLRQEFVDSYINHKINGMNYSDRIWKNKDWLVNKLYESLGQAVYNGKDVRKLAKEMSDIFGSSAFQSQRLINNELSRIVTNAQMNIYEDSGVVQKVQWCATLEQDRTCEDCQNLDGKVFDLRDIHKPEIPYHVSCRCTWLPIVNNWNPRIRRDQDTKENISYKSYSDWAKDKNINI